MSEGHEAPVLLGGIAGTGKTRLGSLLGRHSRLSVTRKTYLWRDVYARHGDLAKPGNLDRCIAASLAIPGVRALRLDPADVAARVAQHPPTYANVFDAIHTSHADSIGKPRWCDQLGLVEAYAEPIFTAFPSARFIHMVGDPRGARPTGRTPGAAGWATGKWLTSMDFATRNSRRFGPQYLVVRHEDLLRDEAGTLREVCAFLGEEVEPSMLLAPVPSPSGSPAPCHARPRRSDLIEWPANRLALTAWRMVGARSIARQIGAGR